MEDPQLVDLFEFGVAKGLFADIPAVVAVLLVGMLEAPGVAAGLEVDELEAAVNLKGGNLGPEAPAAGLGVDGSRSDAGLEADVAVRFGLEPDKSALAARLAVLADEARLGVEVQKADALGLAFTIITLPKLYKTTLLIVNGLER